MKQSRQQKRVGKHKKKKTEQEEQLKLAKSVINNLERKLTEMEQSYRLMKQELNIYRGDQNLNGRSSHVHPGLTPIQDNQRSPEEQQNTNRTHDYHSELSSLRDQVRSLEVELIKEIASVISNYVYTNRGC